MYYVGLMCCHFDACNKFSKQLQQHSKTIPVLLFDETLSFFCLLHKNFEILVLVEGIPGLILLGQQKLNLSNMLQVVELV